MEDFYDPTFSSEFPSSPISTRSSLSYPTTNKRKSLLSTITFENNNSHKFILGNYLSKEQYKEQGINLTIKELEKLRDTCVKNPSDTILKTKYFKRSLLQNKLSNQSNLSESTNNSLNSSENSFFNNNNSSIIENSQNHNDSSYLNTPISSINSNSSSFLRMSLSTPISITSSILMKEDDDNDSFLKRKSVNNLMNRQSFINISGNKRLSMTEQVTYFFNYYYLFFILFLCFILILFLLFCV
ncbi:hypothetical protein ABK040_002368 [Willaertia magna]